MYATSMTSVRPSVCLSVTLVDSDHIVQQKVEMGTWQDRSVSVLAACKRKPTWIVLLSWILRTKLSGVWKYGVLHFSNNNLRNGSSYALDQYRKGLLIENWIRRIEWYHLLAPTTTGSATIGLACRAISASADLYVKICFSVCSGYSVVKFNCHDWQTIVHNCIVDCEYPRNNHTPCSAIWRTHFHTSCLLAFNGLPLKPHF